MEIKATLKLPYKVSTNKIYSGIHWRLRSQIKDKYINAMESIEEFRDYHCDQQVDLEFVFRFKKNALDSSNTTFMGKMIEDCIVKLGFLKDDSPKYIRSVKYTSLKAEVEEDEVEITIREC